MSETPRTALQVVFTEVYLPAETRLSREALAAAAGISEESLASLVRLGLVEPAAPEAAEFTVAAATRLRRMLRLHRDLGVDLEAGAIIVDLLERLERLEHDMARLR